MFWSSFSRMFEPVCLDCVGGKLSQVFCQLQQLISWPSWSDFFKKSSRFFLLTGFRRLATKTVVVWGSAKWLFVYMLSRNTLCLYPVGISLMGALNQPSFHWWFTHVVWKETIKTKWSWFTEGTGHKEPWYNDRGHDCPRFNVRSIPLNMGFKSDLFAGILSFHLYL